MCVSACVSSRANSQEQVSLVERDGFVVVLKLQLKLRADELAQLALAYWTVSDGPDQNPVSKDLGGTCSERKLCTRSHWPTQVFISWSKLDVFV